ncbi:MAG: GNAT family N-acetyltransferase [Micropepsaceae bacterium]
MTISIRRASPSDVDAFTDLVAAKRTQLEMFEPIMWRTGRDANEMTAAFFRHQVAEPNAILLVAEDGASILGFVNAVLQNPPPIYDPGGKTVMIDDFTVVKGEAGDQAAMALLDAVMSEGRSRGAVQLIAVSAAMDERATKWFQTKKLHVASTWWTRILSH